MLTLSLGGFISFINKNYYLVLIGITLLFIALFVVMISKLKRLCFIEFVLFILALIGIGVHIVADIMGYLIYWKGYQELTWIFFATILYFIVLLVDIALLVTRLLKKAQKEAPAEAKEPEEVEATEEGKIEFSPAFDKYLETLEEPIGFFDERIPGYHLTKGMRELLNIKTHILTIDEYKNFITEDDLKTYDTLLKQKKGRNKYRYRLKTVRGIEWFEEVKDFIDGETISTFHKSPIKTDDEILDRNDLEAELSRKISLNEDFGLSFILINNNQNLIKHLGKEASNAVIESYLKTVDKELFASGDRVYKVSSREYCILTCDIDNYRDNIHMVKNKNSLLLESTVTYEGNKYFVTNVLGFVHSDSVSEKNSLEYVEAGRLALYLATNKDCRYVEYNLDELRDNSLEFEKCKVDLSNKFLEDLWLNLIAYYYLPAPHKEPV